MWCTFVFWASLIPFFNVKLSDFLKMCLKFVFDKTRPNFNPVQVDYRTNIRFLIRDYTSEEGQVFSVDHGTVWWLTLPLSPEGSSETPPPTTGPPGASWTLPASVLSLQNHPDTPRCWAALRGPSLCSGHLWPSDPNQAEDLQFCSMEAQAIMLTQR